MAECKECHGTGLVTRMSPIGAVKQRCPKCKGAKEEAPPREEKGSKDKKDVQ